MPVEAMASDTLLARKVGERVVMALARAMKNSSFYEVTHPVVIEVLREAMADVALLLEHEPEFVVTFLNGYVAIDGTPLTGQHASLGNLVGACHRRRVDALVLRRGVTEHDLSHLVEVLSMDPLEIAEAGGPARALEARGVRRASIHKVISREDGAAEGRPYSEWSGIYTTALDVIRGASAEVRTGRALDLRSIQSSVNEIVDDILGERSIVYSLNWMKGMDEYTFVHALHICILSIELGRDLGLSKTQLQELGAATLLHDVGKIFVPLEILRKPAKLDAEEFAIICRHPIDGALVLAREADLPPAAALVAFEHHIHMDRSGYPQMGCQRPLHLFSLMTSIVDVYDALTTLRPYRPALPPLTAVGIMRDQLASRLEPRLLARFLELLGPYPWGTMLRLNDDRLVVVTRPNLAEPEDPFVRIVEPEGEGSVLEEEMSLREADPSTTDFEVLDPFALGMNLTALMHRSAARAARGR